MQTCLANEKITEDLERPDLANTWRLAGESSIGLANTWRLAGESSIDLANTWRLAGESSIELANTCMEASR